MTESQTQRPLAIITGITSGIGLAMARHLSSAGFAVYGVARSEEKLASLNVEMVSYERRDLSDLSDVQACLQGVDLRPWSYAVLINNAGAIEPIGRVDEVDWSLVSKSMTLNGVAPLSLSATFLRALRAAPSCVGRIVQISSGAAHRPVAGWVGYCASKAAMWRGTEVMAAEMDTGRCQVMALSPGVVETPMQAEIRQQSEGSMPDVAWFRQLADDGKLASPDKPAAYLTGVLLDDLGGRRAFPHGETIDLFGS